MPILPPQETSPSSPSIIQSSDVTSVFTYSYPLENEVISHFSASIGAQYFLDPINGSFAHDGKSPAQAWPALGTVVNNSTLMTTTVTSGDFLNLMPGDHGNPDFENIIYTDFVTIRPVSGAYAPLETVYMRNCAYIDFHQVTITPSANGSVPPGKANIVTVRSRSDGVGQCDHITFYNCTIYTYGATSSWTENDWITHAWSAFNVYDSNYVTVDSCNILNVEYGVQWNGVHGTVSKNWIRRFSGDGVQGGGSYFTVEKNLITDCFDVNNGIHNDGVQINYGAQNTLIQDLIIRNNIIIATLDPNRIGVPNGLQGITNFTNNLDNALVENNIVINDYTSHGITMAYNSAPLTITNSTVWHNTIFGFGGGGNKPLIWLDSGSGNVCRNNIAMGYSIASGWTSDHNLTIADQSDANNYFVNIAQHQYRIKAGSPSIDAGHHTLFAADDFEGDTRPHGSWSDCGAEEYGP